MNRASTVKYLGLFTDQKLNWDTHAHDLSQHLARYSSLFINLVQRSKKKKNPSNALSQFNLQENAI